MTNGREVLDVFVVTVRDNLADYLEMKGETKAATYLKFMPGPELSKLAIATLVRRKRTVRRPASASGELKELLAALKMRERTRGR